MKTLLIALIIFCSGIYYFNGLAKDEAKQKAAAQAQQEQDDKISSMLWPGTATPEELEYDSNWCIKHNMKPEIMGGGNAGRQHVVCFPKNEEVSSN